jgi:hypothetical protein
VCVRGLKSEKVKEGRQSVTGISKDLLKASNIQPETGFEQSFSFSHGEKGKCKRG